MYSARSQSKPAFSTSDLVVFFEVITRRGICTILGLFFYSYHLMALMTIYRLSVRVRVNTMRYALTSVAGQLG